MIMFKEFFKERIEVILEVIATNIRDVRIASEYGADRIELCMGLQEDGLTPSFGLIESAVEVATIPINVIIRSHSQSFCYDKFEVDTMKRDIQMARKLGVNGIVIGALTEEGKVDLEVMNQLLYEAEALDVTFHRAFDFSRNFEETLETLAQFKQIKRILTAGGKKSAPDSTAILKQLINYVKESQFHLEIMPGSGIRNDNIQSLVERVKPNEIHIGSGVRFGNSFTKPMDPEKLQQFKNFFDK